MDEIYDLIFGLIFYGVMVVGTFLLIPVLLGAAVLGVVVFFDRKGKSDGDD